MRLKVLLDNIGDDKYEIEHGLSFYIETDNHNILFDMGETDKFYNNALQMNVDLGEVDIAFVSHAHSDHAGGLPLFMKINDSADIYLSTDAFIHTYEDVGRGRNYIGVDQNLKDSTRLVPTIIHSVIDDELQVFADPVGNEFYPMSNRYLYMEKDGIYTHDSFTHEQNLIISEGNKLTVITGCAHRGIVNIIEEVLRLEGRYPDIVIGGFHIGETGSKAKDSNERMLALSERLKSYPTKYYTCHCTGMIGFETLKTVLGDRIEYIETGKELTI